MRDFERQAQVFFDEKERRDRVARKRSLRLSGYLLLGSVAIFIVLALLPHQ